MVNDYNEKESERARWDSNPRPAVLFTPTARRFRRPAAHHHQNSAERYAAESSSPPRVASSSILLDGSSSSFFLAWLQSQGKTKNTIRETINYAKRFGHVLDTGDASPLLTLSPRNKQHAMSALANLAKFTGRYSQFVQIRQNYNLKWSKGDSIQHFHRFFNEELSFDIMLQRI